MRTGDLGELDDDGYLILTGRKKDLLVTAGGKNVSPGPLEDRLRSNALISQAVVVGTAGRSSGTAHTRSRAVRELEGVERQTRVGHRGGPRRRPPISWSTASGGGRRQRERVPRGGDQTIRGPSTRSHEESGELTATLKIKRNVVSERFADQIASIYRSR